MNPKEFFKRWGQGIRDLPPDQILKTKLVSNWGQLVGMILAFIVLMYKGYWYFSVLFIFALIIQALTIIEVSQQYKNFKLMIENIKQMENKMEDKNGL